MNDLETQLRDTLASRPEDQAFNETGIIARATARARVLRRRRQIGVAVCCVAAIVAIVVGVPRLLSDDTTDPQQIPVKESTVPAPLDLTGVATHVAHTQDGATWTTLDSRRVATTRSGDSWRVYDLGDAVTIGALETVRNEVWIAGGDGDRPFLGHWTGDSWERVDPPVKSGTIDTVSASVPTNVWIAASGQVWHWDGSSWQQPEKAETPYGSLLAASSTDNVFVASHDGGTATVLHWDGVDWAGWISQPGQLTALTPAGEGFHAFVDGGERTYIQCEAHGCASYLVLNPRIPAGYALSANGRDVWAVGGDRSPVLARNKNSDWVLVDVPNACTSGRTFVPHDVDVLGATDVDVVGSCDVEDTHRTIALHWDGTQWTAF